MTRRNSACFWSCCVLVSMFCLLSALVLSTHFCECKCNMQDSEVVIKAFKEHERRNGVKHGFAYTPADALAFKYYRDVSPCSELLCQQQGQVTQMHYYINSQAPAVCTYASRTLCPSMCLSTAHACSFIVLAISLCKAEVDPAPSHSVSCDAYAS